MRLSALLGTLLIVACGTPGKAPQVVLDGGDDAGVTTDAGPSDAGPAPTCVPGHAYADGGCIAVPNGQLGAACANDGDCLSGASQTECARTLPDAGTSYGFCIETCSDPTQHTDNCKNGSVCTRIPRAGGLSATFACLQPGRTPCQDDGGCPSSSECAQFDFNEGGPVSLLACVPN